MSVNQRLSTSCPSCTTVSESAYKYYANSGRHADKIFDGLALASCAKCEMSWVVNPPNDSELMEFYRLTYQAPKMNPLRDGRWPIWDNRAASQLTLARLFLPSESKKKMFIDIGPGNGAALSLATFFLPYFQVACIELSERSKRFFTSMEPSITVCSSTTEFEADSASVVCSSHSLEHLRPDSLRSTLGEIHRLLERNGILVLEVPFESDVELSSSVGHAPHLSFFSLASIKHLLSNAGFDVLFLRRMAGSNAKLPFDEGQMDRLSGNDIVRVATLVTGDLLAWHDSDSEPGVIKCVAQKN